LSSFNLFKAKGIFREGRFSLIFKKIVKLKNYQNAS